FRYPLAAQTGKVTDAGWGKQVNAQQLPISTGIAGVLMELQPGAIRELHWHANAAEWGYVIDGQLRVTLFDPEQRISIAELATGDVYYFPRGYAHAIQNSGATPATFILLFDNGEFSEYATFSLTDWLAHTPRPILAETLQVDETALAGLPTGEVYIIPGPIPPPLDEDRPLTPQKIAANSCAYAFSQQPVERYPGGTLKIVGQEQFPLSTTITGAVLTIDPGAFREPHWHPDAAEWIYVLQGSLRLTIFASQGHVRSEEFGVGDVGYVPEGLGHFLENTGEDELRLLLGFNTGNYQQISLSGWLGANPRQLVATNLALDLETVDAFPGDTEYIPEGRDTSA
ncbi:MAG: cupin domain-containing protein, partial [Thermomicrobiales bacterium]